MTRNGAGRVSGLGPTLASIGILQPSPAAGNADADVRLGITRRGCNILNEDKSFHNVWKVFEHVSWATACNEQSFATFCHNVRTMLEQVAELTRAFQLQAEGYCFHFLFRKLLIGEARFRKRSTSFAAVDWHALTVGDLKYMSADQNDHLDAFEPHTSACALSYFFSSVELIGLFFLAVLRASGTSLDPSATRPSWQAPKRYIYLPRIGVWSTALLHTQPCSWRIIVAVL